jgi:murein DD-endopeptidase MepM/ murein hydrolase activator NlpD
MKVFIRIALWCVVAFLLFIIPCSGQNVVKVSWFPQELKQGEVLFVTVKPETQITTVKGDLDGTPIYFYEREGGDFAGIVGVDLAASPGQRSLSVEIKDLERRSFERVFQVQVHAGEFEVQRLTVPPEMVDFTEETYQRYLAERKELKRVFNQVRSERVWRHSFVKPVEGSITSAFGLRRIFNDKARAPHSGVDIGAPEGTAVGACNDGIVVFAQELYLEGKTIIIDHGFGLYSIYMHLSEIQAREGDTVHVGEVIGLVGATGRVTGSHLHWGIKLLGAKVDPFSLVRAVPPEE